MVMQHCTTDDDFESVDAGFIRANATAIRVLGETGRVEIIYDEPPYRIVSGKLKGVKE